jgi:DNA-binding transcriptional MerR regulator
MEPKVSSNNTLFTVTTVADEAKITRQTLYNWVNRGVITPRHDLEGSPVFTPGERDRVVEIAQQRRELEQSMSKLLRRK